MKSKLLFLFTISISTYHSSFSQTQKGAWALGLTGGVSRTSSKVESSLNINSTSPSSIRYSFTPNISYFLSDKFALGMSVGFQGANSNYYSFNGFGSERIKLNSNSFNWVVSPFAKYYIPVGERAAFVLGVHTHINFGKSKSDYIVNGPVPIDMSIPQPSTEVGTDHSTNIAYGIGFRPAFLFFPAEKWGVELSLGNLLGYNYYEFKTDPRPSNGINFPTTTKSSGNTLDILGINSMGVGVSLFYFIK